MIVNLTHSLVMNIELFPVIFCYQRLAKQINAYRVLPRAGTRYSAVKRQIKDSKKRQQ